MDWFPEEFLTPPVPLAALVGIPSLHLRISDFLLRYQTPVTTISVADVHDAQRFSGKPRKPPDAKLPPPVGIFKSEWLKKHRKRCPAAIALFLEREKVYGDQWQQVFSEIDSIKKVIEGRNIKLLILLVQNSPMGEMNEERFLALKKRSEVDPKCCITFIDNEGPEFQRSLYKIGSLLSDIASSFYRDEGRRVKARIEKKTYSHWELTVRYCLKLGLYAEFRRDWASALKSYDSAYLVLIEGFSTHLVSTPIHMQPIFSLEEIRSVAEITLLKILTLQLHAGKPLQALKTFQKHLAFFQDKVGPPEGAFLHFHWLSRQHHLFAQLLHHNLGKAGEQGQRQAQTSGLGTTGSPSSPILVNSTQSGPSFDKTALGRSMQSAHYYRLAGLELLRYVHSVQVLIDSEGLREVQADFLSAPLYIGQPGRVRVTSPVQPAVGAEQAAMAVQAVAWRRLTEPEFISHHLISHREKERVRRAEGSGSAVLALSLLQLSLQLFLRDGSERTAAHVAWQLGQEELGLRLFPQAVPHLEQAAALYRKQAWLHLLAACLHCLQSCSLELIRSTDAPGTPTGGSSTSWVCKYLEYSLEMAALPVPVGLKLGQEGVTELKTLLQGGSGRILPHTAVELDIGASSDARAALCATACFCPGAGATSEAGSDSGTSSSLVSVVRVGEAALLQVSVLSLLPWRVSVLSLRVHFSQDDLDCDVDLTQGLSLECGSWKRTFLSVIPVRPGRLDCTALTLRLSALLSVRLAVAPPSSPLPAPSLQFEPACPALRPPFLSASLGEPSQGLCLSLAGQTILEVDPPRNQVDLLVTVLGDLSPAGSGEAGSPAVSLVGEAEAVSITVRARGHSVRQGRLTAKLVSLRNTSSGSVASSAGSLSASSSGTFLPPAAGETGSSSAVGSRLQSALASPVHFVSELPDRSSAEESSVVLLEVPAVEAGSEWEGKVAMRWREPGEALLTLLLSYSTAAEPEKELHVSVTRSLRGQEPLQASFRALGGYRSDSLLSAPGTAQGPLSLCLQEPCTLLACLTPSLPSSAASPAEQWEMRVLSVAVEGTDSRVCGVESMMGPGSEPVSLGTGEEYTQLIKLSPLALTAGDGPALFVPGSLKLQWQRRKAGAPFAAPVETAVDLPAVAVVKAAVGVTVECPDSAVLGTPFALTVRLRNHSARLLRLRFSVSETAGFLLCGAQSGTHSLLPHSSGCLPYRLLPITAGMLQLPRVSLSTPVAKLQLSPHASKIFVFPLQAAVPTGNLSD